MKNTIELVNEKTRIIYDYKDRIILWHDYVDKANMPAFSTQTKSNLQKAFMEIKNAFVGNTTIYDVKDILWKNNIVTRSRCRMD